MIVALLIMARQPTKTLGQEDNRDSPNKLMKLDPVVWGEPRKVRDFR